MKQVLTHNTSCVYQGIKVKVQSSIICSVLVITNKRQISDCLSETFNSTKNSDQVTVGNNTNSSTSVCADITDATAVTSNTSISSNETTVHLSYLDFIFSNEDHVKALFDNDF